MQTNVRAGFPETAEQRVLGGRQQGEARQQHRPAVAGPQALRRFSAKTDRLAGVKARRRPAPLPQKRGIGLLDAPQRGKQGGGRRRDLALHVGDVGGGHAVAEKLVQHAGQPHAPGQELLHLHAGKALGKTAVRTGKAVDALPQQRHLIQTVGRVDGGLSRLFPPAAQQLGEGHHLGQQHRLAVQGIEVLEITPRAIMRHHQQGPSGAAVRAAGDEVLEGGQEGLAPVEKRKGRSGHVYTSWQQGKACVRSASSSEASVSSTRRKRRSSR